MENAASASEPKVLVYVCSGASNLGQLANDLALRLDSLGLAELVCLAELGAGDGECESPAAAQRVLAISGCAKGCCASMLERHGVDISRTITLAGRGITKAKHVLVDESERERVFGQVLAELAPFLRAEDR